MSRKIAALVYSRRAGSMIRKALLAYFAERANDDGTGVWASKQRIADEIEASRRAVIANIQEMVKEGLLIEIGKRPCSNGHTIEYAMNLAAIAKLPEADPTDPCKIAHVDPAHVQDIHVTRAPDSRLGVNRVHTNRPLTVLEPSIVCDRTDQAVNDPPPPDSQPDPDQQRGRSKSRGVARGSRLPPNWTPTPQDYAFAAREGLTPKEISREADRFRDYWCAAAGQNAVKLDWAATWRNWVRSDYRRGSAADERRRAEQTLSAFDRVAARLARDAAGSAPPCQPDPWTIEGEYSAPTARAAAGR